jgi:KEOPS complex subunit Pcc1
MNNPSNSIEAVIKIQFNEKILEIIETSLTPESESPSSDRSKTSIRVEDKHLIIRTSAADTTALRASLNSYLRWVNGIQNILEELE